MIGIIGAINVSDVTYNSYKIYKRYKSSLGEGERCGAALDLSGIWVECGGDGKFLAEML